MGDLFEAASPPALRISAAALRRALIAGARHVISRRELLNRINVFPVPDGDTDTNLAFTLSAVLRGALSRRAGSAPELLRGVAEDALDGARGNSGAILAQFLHGVAEVSASQRELTVPLLAEAIGAGARQARGALSQPCEGTILSVIAAFAQAVERPMGDVHGWFRRGLRGAESALQDTPRQLAVLRHAGVVDAGGQGFVDLLVGIDGFLATGRTPTPELQHDAALDAPTREPEGMQADADPAHRWCSECVVQAQPRGGVAAADVDIDIDIDIDASGGENTVDRDRLRAAVEALGASSVVIAGGAGRVRVHAHVADPGRLFECASAFGHVTARKADDMHAQQRAIARRTQVAVVTDSGADLPEVLLEETGLNMVPVRVNFGDEDFLDKVTLKPAEFHARMRAGGELPRTSQPPPGDFRRQFELLLGHQPAVCYVGISRAISGTLQSAESAVARCDGARVRVLDSGHASCGQGLVALALAEAAQAGADLDALASLAAQLQDRTETFACARDISHAVRGGRLPGWVAPIAAMLPVTPIARMRRDGKLHVAGVLPGKSDVPRRFANHVAARVQGGRRVRVLVGHCGCAADGELLLATMRKLLDCEQAWLVEAGPAVGAHAGPGSLVVGLQYRDC